MNLHITTPFGRRSLTAAQIQAQAQAAGCSHETTVNKWTVFRDIAAARPILGISDRTMAVLDALLTFHPETVLTPGEGAGLVVFPSNAALALRAHGIAEPTLRRHLAVLVEAGIIIRRDSPNGKRYARRGQGGVVAQAFGFDLMPLVARAGEFAAHAEALRGEAQALRVARERVTLLRRDCAKLILALEEAESAPGAALPLWARYSAILGVRPRTLARVDLTNVGDALAVLASDVSKLLLTHQDLLESSGNADRNERHNQNSNPDAISHEPSIGLKQKKAPAFHPESAARSVPDETPGKAYPLGLVLDACPDIVEFAHNGIRSWRDLVDTANLARSALGISPDAWRGAQEVMGPDTAAVTVAAILQRVEHIKNPGGYLRFLVDRKRAGEYSLGPVLQALARIRLKTHMKGRKA